MGLLACLLLCGVLGGCGTESQDAPAPQEPEAAAVYGSSANMRLGGRIDGDENGVYYSWQGTLYYEPPDGAAQAVDENGGRFLCLAGDTLYYVSEEDGRTGIYARERAESGRRLLCETPARYLYEYGGFLYFIRYPGDAGLCRVPAAGGEIETLSGAPCDGLIVTEDGLFYRELESGRYVRRAFRQDQTLQDAETWIPWVDDTMPLADPSGAWLYYEQEDAAWHYRVGLDDSTKMGRYQKTGADFLVWNGVLYENGTADDMSGSPKTVFCDSPLARPFGVAAGELFYVLPEYAEGASEARFPEAERLSLFACPLEGGESRLVQAAQGTITAEEAEDAYTRLLSGDVPLLGAQESGLIRRCVQARFSLPDAARLFADLTGDGIPECFLRSGSNSLLFHAVPGGVVLWLADLENEADWYEPLRDGSLLYRYEYGSGGYGADVYDVYAVQSGGALERQSSCQHLTADTDALEGYDPERDTQLLPDSYYVGDAFSSREAFLSETERLNGLRALP